MLIIKGSILSVQGAIQMNGGEQEKAALSFQIACSFFDNAISLTPQSVNAHLNKGNALRDLAQVASGSSKKVILQQSLKSYLCASEIDPKNSGAYFGKGYVYLDLAEVEGISSNDIMDNVTLAVESFDKILQQNPVDSAVNINANSEKGWALLRRGSILKEEGRSTEADVAFVDAIKIYRLVQRFDPDNENANKNIQWLIRQIQGRKLEAKLAAEEARAAVVSHNLEEERRYRKQLNLGLVPVDGYEARQFLADIYAPESPDLSGVQAAALPFYKECRLIQYTDKSVEPEAVYYYLYKPGYAHLLDWTSAPLTNESLILEPETVIPYTRFYCYFVRNRNAQFILVEYPEDIAWRPEATEEDRIALDVHLMPLVFVQEGDDAFLLNGTALIADTLLKLDFLISKDNVSTMTNQSMDFPRGFLLLDNEQIIFEKLKIAKSPVSDKIYENFAKSRRAAVVPHDLNDERRYRVPLDLGLAPVYGYEARQFLLDIYAPESPDLSEVQAVDLSFYKEYRLYKYIDKSADPVEVYYYLYKPGITYLLDWSNAPIYSINTTGVLQLAPETVIDYAKFFFYFVRGQLGTFIIAEKPQDLVWLPEAIEEEKTVVESQLMPVTYQGVDDDKRYVLHCSIIFKDALFSSDITIAQENVKVIDPETNEELVEQRGDLRVVNSELLCEEQQLPVQPPPHSVKERKLSAQRARAEVWVHHPEKEARYRMPMDFGLSPASENEATRFLEDIYEPSSDLSGVQVALLPFFKRRKLYQYTDKTTEPANIYYYLYKPGDARLITWSAEAFMKMNEGGQIILNPYTILLYVRFYHYFVHNQDSPFILIEKPENIVWQPDATTEERAELNRHIMPLTYLGIVDKYHLVQEIGLINNMLFRRELRIPAETMTIINPDTNLPIEIEEGMVIPSNEQLLAKDLKVVMPNFDIME